MINPKYHLSFNVDMTKIYFSMPVIFVEDIKVSREFYQHIFSLEVEADFGENVVFKKAFSIWQKKRAKKIIFENKIISEKNGVNDTVELYFETIDIESIWEKISSSKVEIIHPVKEEPWGQRVFRLYDPDKFIIEVAEPMSEVIKRFHQLGMSKNDISIKTQMPLKAVEKIVT